MLKSLLRNSGWNLAGYVLPAIAALLSAPFLFHALGAERFGLLSIAWAVLGMVTVFDLGIGRALTRWIAELRASGQQQDLAAATGTALVLSVVLGGVVSAGLSAVMAGPGDLGARVSAEIRDETRLAMYLLILGLWVSVYGSALRGGLEGFSDFRRLNFVKIPAGVASFALPCLAAAYSPSLPLAIGTLVASRVAANMAMSRYLRVWIVPAWRDIDLTSCKSLIHYGGWITVSSLIGPVIVYADRFVIGYLVSAAAVSYFSVPSDALSRVLVLPVSLASAAFPAIVGERAQTGRVSRIVAFATSIVALAVVPFTLLAIVFARAILDLWMGSGFADESTDVFRVLAAGFGVNALAQVPLLALQALGSARWTAQWHLVQLVPYLLALGAATYTFVIVGAAVAGAVRAAIDMLGMWLLLRRKMKARP
jgi:O-antigen/teichoic acid export membrane protein